MAEIVGVHALFFQGPAQIGRVFYIAEGAGLNGVAEAQGVERLRGRGRVGRGGRNGAAASGQHQREKQQEK